MDTCATDFTWVNIQEDVIVSNGILGLNFDPAAFYNYGIESGVSYIDTLYKQDIIDDKVFGVAL